MYEDKGYENIKQSILDNINMNINKQEGSIVNDIVSPISIVLNNTYIELNKVIDIMFLDSTGGEFLDKKVKDYGLNRKSGTKATCKVTFAGIAGTLIPIGSLVQTKCGLLFQTVEEKTIADNLADITVEAMEIGSVYNVAPNIIVNIPISINGVISVNNFVNASGGTDIETDDSLAKRYLQRLQTPATSGNVNQYRQWALEVPGTGDAKVFPLWNGPGTVKLVIVDSNKQPATESLITEVYDYIETVRPIGANVTVVSGTAKIINITAKVVLAPGHSLQSVIDSFEGYIEEYFKSIAFTTNYVSHAKAGTILLGTDGVIDYSDLKLNDTASNILLADEEIPVIGTVELEV